MIRLYCRICIQCGHDVHLQSHTFQLWPCRSHNYHAEDHSVKRGQNWTEMHHPGIFGHAACNMQCIVTCWFFPAVQWCYLWRPWWATGALRGRGPVLPWGGSACWSRSAPSQISSRGRTPDTKHQCWRPWGRKELQILSLLPALEDT